MSWDQLKTDAAYLEANRGVLTAHDQEFIDSLLQQFNDRGLSEKQEVWVGKMTDRTKETLARRGQQQSIAKVSDDLVSITKLFATAQVNLKKPFVLISSPAGGLRLKVAKSGVNQGLVYVYLDGQFEDRVWLGKITQDGRYVPSNEARAANLLAGVTQGLVDFAKDPQAAAMKYGREIGACCFCGKTLTDERSVLQGYGPVCATNFGLPWGDRPQRVCEPVALGQDTAVTGAGVVPPKLSYRNDPTGYKRRWAEDNDLDDEIPF